MRSVLVVQWLISLPHAVGMMRKLNARKHAHMGFYFEIEDLGMSIYDARQKLESSVLQCYSLYNLDRPIHPAVILRVYRDA